MLQQTQVATVLPYYERFLKAFPTIDALAAAEEQSLLKLWEGLGYYRRARSLHAAAKQMVERHDGQFPLEFDEVLSLPGIGRYTAGAILSISDGQRLPVLEGNTLRVYSRWIALRSPPQEKNANELLWELATKMLPRKATKRADVHSGIFNQSAMELGALICTPQQPDCLRCPVRTQCRTNQLGLQKEIPGKVSKTKYEDRTEFALVVSKRTSRDRAKGSTDTAGGNQYLVRPLPLEGRWAGLWDFPRPTKGDFESIESAADWLSSELGVTVRPGICLETIRHAVTKYRITLHVHEAKTRLRKPPPAPWRWVSLDEMADLPMSVTGRGIARFLSDSTQHLLPLD